MDSTDADKLQKEVKKLETEFERITKKLSAMQSEAKIEESKRKLIEAKIDHFIQTTKFYAMNTDKLIKRFQQAQAINSQFSAALEYYENIISDYEDTCFNKPEDIDIDELIGESTLSNSNMKIPEEFVRLIEEHNNTIQQLIEKMNLTTLT